MDVFLVIRFVFKFLKRGISFILEDNLIKEVDNCLIFCNDFLRCFFCLSSLKFVFVNCF